MKLKDDRVISSKNNAPFTNQENFIFIIITLLLIVGTLCAVLPFPDKIQKLINFFKSPWHIANAIIVTIFIILILILFPPDSDESLATKTGIYSIIIAFCAFLGVPFVPFWVTHFFIFFNK